MSQEKNYLEESIQPENNAKYIGSSSGQTDYDPQELTSDQKKYVIIGIFLVIIFVLVLAVTVYYLMLPTTNTSKIRDVFIIFLAIESILIGLTLVILMIQLAKLLNLLQNEIRPIVESTNETVSNLRGTTAFLSENLVEPVIKANEYAAGLRQLLILLGLSRRTSRKSN